MAGPTVSHRIQQLTESEYAPTVNSMLDAGKSAAEVCAYLNAQGFRISTTTLYKYSKMRREGLLESIANPPAELRAEDIQPRDRLLTELQALDMLIEKGYEAIKEMTPEEVTPKMFMEAIRLKYELTGGSHAFLTEYGYNSIRQVEDQKWRAVLKFLMVYVPEERRAEVLEGVEQIERNVYEGTPWYGEYMKAKAMMDSQEQNT